MRQRPMKLVSIEIAEAIEKGIVKFLEEKGEAASMRFTRFIDLGGKQVELYLYPPQKGASVWCTIGVKSVFRTEEGDCAVYAVKIPSVEKKLEDVLVNPVPAKLPALVERILNFLKEDLLQKASEKGAALEGGGLALDSQKKGSAEPGPETSDTEGDTPLEDISEETDGSGAPESTGPEGDPTSKE